jgi:hypothetical protein
VNTSLDMYAEIKVLPLRAVVALVCASFEPPMEDELPEGDDCETTTERPLS